MKMPEMPEPEYYVKTRGTFREVFKFYYDTVKVAELKRTRHTPEQMKQYGRDLLDEAAKTLRDIDALHNAGLVDVTVDALRSMKEKL